MATLSGAGVAGSSLVYAKTLYRAPSRFFDDPQWARPQTSVVPNEPEHAAAQWGAAR